MYPDPKSDADLLAERWAADALRMESGRKMKTPPALGGLILLAVLLVPISGKSDDVGCSGKWTDIESKLEKFGIGGVYRVDCSQPISSSDDAQVIRLGPNNQFSILYYTDGKIPLPTLELPINDAQILDTSNIQFTIGAQAPFANEIIFRKENNKLRMWFAATVDPITGKSTPSVADGKGINRPDTQWLEECGLPKP